MTNRERLSPALVALIAAAHAQMERETGETGDMPIVTVSRVSEYDDRPIREPRPKNSHPRVWRKPK